jgi:hypothetical protein
MPKSSARPSESSPSAASLQTSYEPPPLRRLRGFSFDPSLSGRLDTALVNQRIYTIPWEKLKPGPVGEYVEVVDRDPPSNAWYAPVDLEHPNLLAQDGLAASTSNPQFHQQMVYAVAMTTIRNFERALGRPVVWSSRIVIDDEASGGARYQESYVPRLRIYPHGLRDANAYYSPGKKALLFGYFPAGEAADDTSYPGGLVFTCLSHDIVAHETTHALLDGIHPRFMEVTQPDGLAFHEAFADIVALFQHFTFPEVLRHEIGKTRGDLEAENLLGALAQQFGRATGNRGSLRDALGSVNSTTGKWERRTPDPRVLETEFEPHARGAVLVSAVFDAFITIYNGRIKDLQRIASGGSGILPVGDLHPDLVGRFALEAAKSAQHVLTMCIRALDYCPPVDITFGDYLRALITADFDVVPNDDLGYRLAFVDAFRSHGIYPKGLRALSEESLRWDRVSDTAEKSEQVSLVMDFMKSFVKEIMWKADRKERWELTRNWRRDLHSLLISKFQSVPAFANDTGLDFSQLEQGKRMRFEVHALWPLQRQRPDGSTLNQMVFSVLQKRWIEDPGQPDLRIWGGCTFIVDLETATLRYMIRQPIDDTDGVRIRQAKQFRLFPPIASLRDTYSNDENDSAGDEPFALLHASY